MITLSSGHNVSLLTYGGFIFLVLVLVVGVTLAARRATGRGDSARSARNLLPTLVSFGQTLWLIITGLLAYGGFFAQFDARPPHFILGILPPFLLVVILALYSRTRDFLIRIPASWVVGFQVFRVAVEVILWSLAHSQVIPKAMTFEGRNFDIITGLTAPPVAYLCFVRRGPRWLAFAWNAMGLLLLANVVGIAILSAPGPLYHSANGLPNLLPSVFPFAWLPYYLVPLALLGHLVSLAQLTQPAPTDAPKDKT